MVRIQFFPSKELDERLTAKADELGISKGSLAKTILDKIENFDAFLQNVLNETTGNPNSNLVEITASVIKAMENFAKKKPNHEFILNDVDEFKRIVPMNMRAIVGRAVFQNVSTGKTALRVVFLTDSDGDLIVKRRQRAVLYISK